jgi:UDP-N-acetyl-D-glucosamine dehydrogenase
MKSARALRRRIERCEVTVCVVGQGYVGLSVAAGAALAGMTVTGVDLDKDRIAALAAGRNVVPGIEDALFALATETGRLRFSADTSVAAEADVVLICVPTPVIEHRPDLGAVTSAAAALAPQLRAGSLVVLESTTYPGTTEQVVRPLLESAGLRAGRDFLLAYSPERIDPGNAKYGLANTPRVVGGMTTEATEVAAAFYGQIVDEVVAVSSCKAAELAKLLENTFRMVNIGLVNELAMLCADQDIDVWEVIRAAASKPFGFMPFYPGPGVGGHCIPLDPRYLAWQSRRDTGKPFRILELAEDVNSQMPAYVATRVTDALNAAGTPIHNASVFALGVTYKPDVGDIRESAAIRVLAHLQRRGARVMFHDPFIERIDEHGVDLRRRPLTDKALAAADCVLLLTPHDTYDIEHLIATSRLLFDARNAADGVRRPNVVTL